MTILTVLLLIGKPKYNIHMYELFACITHGKFWQKLT
jgi:hypothetical protein